MSFFFLAISLITFGMQNGAVVSKTDPMHDALVRVDKECSGAMIAKNWVLTAKHCTHRGYDAVFTNRDRCRMEIDEEFVRPTKQDTSHAPDIALLKLRPHNCPITIAKVDWRDWRWDGFRTFHSYGFGRGNRNRDVAEMIPIQSLIEDRSQIRTFIFNLPHILESDAAWFQASFPEYHWAWFDWKNGQSFCSGDSGGPVAYSTGNQTKIVAINAMKLSDSNGCRIGKQDLIGFTRISHHREWAESIMQGRSGTNEPEENFFTRENCFPFCLKRNP